MQQQHGHQHGHEREHVHVHAQHYEKDKAAGRMWLYGGIALLFIALVYSATLLFRAKPTPGNLQLTQVNFDPSHDDLGISVGPANAPVTVREFADFQCPACGGFEPVVQQMRKDYVDTGKVRFVFFDLPLEDIHPDAVIAAQMVRCAGMQDRYWQMHDLLYAKQSEWTVLKDPLSTLVGYGSSVGADGTKLQVCIRDGFTHEAVVNSESYGESLGVRATPTFAVNNQAVTGGVSYADLKALIDQELAAANVKH